MQITFKMASLHRGSPYRGSVQQHTRAPTSSTDFRANSRHPNRHRLPRPRAQKPKPAPTPDDPKALYPPKQPPKFDGFAWCVCVLVFMAQVLAACLRSVRQHFGGGTHIGSGARNRIQPFPRQTFIEAAFPEANREATH